MRASVLIQNVRARLAPYVLLICFSGYFVSCGNKEQGTEQTSNAVPDAPSSVVIGKQEWTTQDLDVLTYRNGDPVAHVQDAEQWIHATSGAWCWYNNDSSAGNGRLYNWFAVNDPRGLVPKGWHVPEDHEWHALETELGTDSVGYRLRAEGRLWPGASRAVDNSSGFRALPRGIRSEGARFSDVGTMAVYWCASGGSAADAWCFRLIHYTDREGAQKMVTGVGYMPKTDGYAVRCVRDHAP